MNNIIPTVGRKVWYFPSTDVHDDDAAMMFHERDGEKQPIDATVVAVYADDIVNLVIFDVHGHIFCRRNVKLLSDGERRPSMGRYATWMPYQVAKAKEETITSGHPAGSGASTFKGSAFSEVGAKAVHHDEAMDKLTQVGVPLGLTLVGRIEWMMANSPPKAVDQTSPSRPMAHYGIEELRSAWDVKSSATHMRDGNIFSKTAIDEELRYRGDSYGSPRAVASRLIPNTKSA